MAMPKGYRTNININNQKIGPDRRQEILDDITNYDTLLPKSVMVEDMDQTFLEYVKSEDGFSVSIGGKEVPVIFLTIQRWTEFTKTWNFTDENKNIEMPFITVVRKPDIQQGQNQAGLWNIPGNRTYTIIKVPTWDGVRRGIDLYKIPQPTPIDINYEVRLFTNRMRDLNEFNKIIQKSFQSRQCYIFPNGHPMPLHLESIGDESNIDSFESRRFYVQAFEIKLLGYLLDEDDFEVVPTINRTLTSLEIDEKRIQTKAFMEPIKKGNEVVYSFIWKQTSDNVFSFRVEYDVNFTVLQNIEHITRIVIKVNGVGVFDGTVLTSPLILYGNDEVTITVTKDFSNIGKFVLIGNTTS